MSPRIPSVIEGSMPLALSTESDKEALFEEAPVEIGNVYCLVIGSSLKLILIVAGLNWLLS